MFTTGERTDSGTLPNSYNTPIHLAGVLVADRHNASSRLHRADGKFASKMLLIAARCARQLQDVAARGISSFDSYERSRTDLEEAIPNVPYLWYWNYVAVLECVKFLDRLEVACLDGPSEKFRAEIKPILTEFRNYVTTFVAYLTASHYSGVDGQFDASDFLFSIAISALRSPDEHHGGSEKIVSHALEVFFGRHIASEGSIVPRSPAFIDLNQRPITISTAEHATLLLEALGPYCDAHIDRLDQLAQYIVSRRFGVRGWGSESGRVTPSRNVFVVTGSIAFLLRYAALLDSHAEALALASLGVPVESAADHIGLELSDEMEATIKREIVWPIKNGNRDLATMSLVLKGPPGTAKTTSAKRIAALLDWPIIILDQGVFLREGYEQVEAEAERIFRLLGHAKDKVVLFDEFEEMILDRTKESGEKVSRFLTTSMLPRLQRIRSQANVVFVIATNHIDSVDSAAYRFGRIDKVISVELPDATTRMQLYRKILQDVSLTKGSTDLLRAMGFPRKWALTRGKMKTVAGLRDAVENLRQYPLTDFGYGEIKQVVRLVRLRELRSEPVSVESLQQILQGVAMHSARAAQPPPAVADSPTLIRKLVVT